MITMKEIIGSRYKNTLNKKALLIELPTICPFCHVSISPIKIYQTEIDTVNGKESITLLFQCSNCNNFILSTYLISNRETIHNSIKCYTTSRSLITYEPRINIDIPQNIMPVSPRFCKIYEQSLLAEAFSLDELTGIGLRKSIEFLIKDYLSFISNNETDKNRIKNLTLNKSINEIADSRIKALALATTWIGNDETHYIKKWEDKDINDMKEFINTLLRFISYELSLKKAESMTKK